MIHNVVQFQICKIESEMSVFTVLCMYIIIIKIAYKELLGANLFDINYHASRNYLL